MAEISDQIFISIIIPTFNEEKYIERCLDSIFKQNFDGMNFEILVADGMSTDSTVTILKRYAEQYSQLHVIVNEKRYQVFALNELIKICRGKYIVRCDAHAIYPIGYFENLVSHLERNPEVGNVGSRVITVPPDMSLKSRVIATALGSKFGVGASHRTLAPSQPIEVDTVLFGAWPKRVFDTVGGFDESFIRGQDLEHNMRIIKSGMKVVQISGAAIQYFGRDSYVKLFHMMKQYASAKPMIMKKHGVIPNFRSLMPCLFFLGLLFSLFVSFPLAIGVGLIYLAVALYFAAKETKNSREGLRFFARLVCCYLIQHAGHAWGMVRGCFHAFKGKSKTWEGTR